MKRLCWLITGVIVLVLVFSSGCGTGCDCRDFSSLTELNEWLLENDISEKPDITYAEDWYGRALEVQEDAMRDGFIISADYDYDAETETVVVWCTTVINGRIFYWDPETDEVFEDTSMGTVK